MRVVASLTTVPSRIMELGDTLETVVSQTLKPDEIALNLPRYCLKEQSGYSIPSYLWEGVRIYQQDRDWGPITKLLPTVEREPDPDTLIITVDDDILYSDRTFETLVAGMNGDNCVVGIMGCVNKKNGRDAVFFHSEDIKEAKIVDCLGGYRGVCYRRGLIRNNVWYDFMSVCQIAGRVMLDDDAFMSRYLSRERVGRLVVPGMSCFEDEKFDFTFRDFAESNGIYRNPEEGDGVMVSKMAIKEYYGF